MNEENELIKRYIAITNKIKDLEIEKQEIWEQLKIENNNGTILYKIGKARGLK